MALFQIAIVDKNWKKYQIFAVFWYVFPHNFCSPGLNDLKVTGTLLLY